MKIGVAGLWHLGTIYSAAFASLGHDVIAYDPDPDTAIGYTNGQLKVYEPDLANLISIKIQTGNLKFSFLESDLSDLDLLVLAYDTPVDANDFADSNFVISEFRRIVMFLNRDTHIMISSQLPVGSSETIERILKKVGHRGKITVQPENLRLGKGLDSFFNPTRIIVGTKDGKTEPIVVKAFQGIDAPIIWMHLKSAEMTKHALNAFLATSITFMGEISEICEKVGADAKEVENGIKSDPRIGKGAYLTPGLGFAGGTLARDVRKLADLQQEVRGEVAILSSLLQSNQHNNNWIVRNIETILQEKPDSKICFWGISYVEKTDTLRRSEIYKIMKNLVERNIQVSYVENFPIKDQMDSRILCLTEIEESLRRADILVISKKLIRFSDMEKDSQLAKAKDLWILDPSRVLSSVNSKYQEQPRYLTVGRGS